MALPNIYEGNYSRLVIMPLALVAISLIIILFLSPIKYGIDLRGGTLITLQLTQAVDEAAIKTALEGVGEGSGSISIKRYANPLGEVAEIEMATDERIKSIDDNLDLFDSKVKEVETVEIELANLKGKAANGEPDTADKIKQAEADYDKKTSELIAIGKSIESSANSIGVTDSLSSSTDAKILKNEVMAMSLKAKDTYKSNIMASLSGAAQYSTYSIEEISPSLSKVFIEKVVNMALFSIVLAFIVIMLIFRQPLPCLIVLSGATADIVMSMGAMGALGIPLTLTSFAALMMMAGLSLDTDMMLTIKVLKRTEGNPRDRAYDAFSTGFAMTSTVLAGFGMLFVLGVVTHITAYYQIGAIGLIGLIGDLIMTWGFNGPLALWYAEGKFPKIFGKK